MERWRRASALLGVAGLMLAGCGGGGGGDAAESETTVSTFGQFADRADLPTVVFDGTTCTYIGPDTVEPGTGSDDARQP